jgi:arylamine N-acetyltransferase
MTDTHAPDEHSQNPDLFARYAGLLGVTWREPTLVALVELVAAHLTRVPFENISKLYHRKHARLRHLPNLELYLDGIERFNFGGTCYTNNYYLFLLLEHMGYDVELCGADMSNPDVHIVSMVKVDDREYIVDVGNAAPFHSPLPRDLPDDHVVSLGRDRYVLKPQDLRGRSRMEMYRDGRLRHGYTANPTPRRIEHFDRVIRHSYTDDATFMNALLLVRFYPDHSVAVNNLELIESRGTESRVTTLADRDELVSVIEERFGMPRAMVADAIADLGELGDAWT